MRGRAICKKHCKACINPISYIKTLNAYGPISSLNLTLKKALSTPPLKPSNKGNALINTFIPYFASKSPHPIPAASMPTEDS